MRKTRTNLFIFYTRAAQSLGVYLQAKSDRSGKTAKNPTEPDGWSGQTRTDPT